MTEGDHQTEILPAAPGDLEPMVALARELGGTWFTPKAIEHMQIDLRLQHVLKATRGADVVGFVSWFVKEAVAQIGWMGVVPPLHRRGIGRKLIARLVEELRGHGIRKLRVETLGASVDYEPYERTRAFYHAMGFRDVRSLVQDNPECPELLILEMDVPE